MAVMNDTALLYNGYEIVAEYWNGEKTLKFWKGNGQIFSKITQRKRSPWVKFFRNEEEANEFFRERQALARRLGLREYVR